MFTGKAIYIMSVVVVCDFNYEYIGADIKLPVIYYL